jgi:hypothetical protein
MRWPATSRVWRARGRLTWAIVLLVTAAGLAATAVVADKGPSARAALGKQLNKVTRSLNKGDWAAVAQGLEQALAAARKQAPLTVRKASVTTTRPAGVGMFAPPAGGVVEGREVMLYVELAGVEHRALPDGTFERWLDVSAAFSYRDPDEGPIALGDKALGTHRVTPRTAADVVSFGIDVGLSEKAPAGRYDLTLKIVDRVGARESTAPVFFVLK